MELEVVDGGFAVDIEISTDPTVADVALAVVRGEVGPAGPAGGVGPQGVSGQVGERGLAGERGEQGIQGIQGVAGVAGERGERGEKGDKGDTGEQGVAGVSLDIQGAVATYADLPVGAAAGDAWIVLADGKLYYRDSSGYPADGAGVPFQGPQGIPGVAGERGEVGATGAAGVAGSQGVAGVQGVAGADGQGFVWRGAYSLSGTYAAYDVVSYAGSSYVALTSGVTQAPAVAPSSWAALALKGDTGATGATGATGPAGPAATTDGAALGTPTSGNVSACVGQVADLSIVAFSAATTRAVGTGDFPFGVKLQRAVTFSAVTYRCHTADASGSLRVELRKNGVAVAGTALTADFSTQVGSGTVITGGPWAFAAGDIITVYVTLIGTTPGKGLIADIRGLTT